MIRGNPDNLPPASLDEARRLPWGVVSVVVLLCVAPVLFEMVGLDLHARDASDALLLDILNRPDALAQLPQVFQGNFIHALLEWTAFLAGVFTFVIALTYWRATGDRIPLVMGTVILLSGVMDGLHALSVESIFDVLTDPGSFPLYTWTISRTFNGLVILVTAAVLLLRSNAPRSELNRWFFGIITIGLAVSVVGFELPLLTGDSPPAVYAAQGVVRRPMDIPPLIIFVLLATVVLPLYYRRFPTLFAESLWLSALPHVASQVYMTFGSQTPYDHYFNVAHALKAAAYVVPIAGLLMDIVNAYDRSSNMADALYESEQRYRTLSQASFEGVIVMQGTEVVDANPEAARIFGIAEEDFGGSDLLEVVPERDAARIRTFLRLRATDSVIEQRCVRPDGTELMAELRARGLEDAELDGLFILIVRDNTVRHAFEERLEAQRNELVRVNQDVEQFAYVASHDLRSPLRAIDNLSQWIADDLGEDLPQETARHIDLMQNRVQRMDKLLTDLLEYSRVGRRNVDTTGVDVAELAASVWSLLDHPEGFELVLGEGLPKLQTAVTPLQQVLHNLLTNALKHHDRDHGTITFDSAPDADGFYRFRVTDDGPGIPEEFHDKVFQLFQTLRPRDEVEGSGMGLALIKRIVQDGGGAIRLESPIADGRGTRFAFTWPLAWLRGEEEP